MHGIVNIIVCISLCLIVLINTLHAIYLLSYLNIKSKSCSCIRFSDCHIYIEQPTRMKKEMVKITNRDHSHEYQFLFHLRPSKFIFVFYKEWEKNNPSWGNPYKSKEILSILRRFCKFRPAPTTVEIFIPSSEISLIYIDIHEIFLRKKKNKDLKLGKLAPTCSALIVKWSIPCNWIPLKNDSIAYLDTHIYSILELSASSVTLAWRVGYFSMVEYQ